MSEGFFIRSVSEGTRSELGGIRAELGKTQSGRGT
jgi:hypothetical protein